MIDIGLSAIGVGIAFNPLKYALKQAWKSARLKSAAIKKITSYQLKMGKAIYDLCKWINKRLRNWFGIKMKTITLYTKLKEYGFGKVNGWILNKLLDNVADLLSPGSLFVAILDVSLDGSYDKRLWKIYEQN